MTPLQLTNEILDRWLTAVERECGSPGGYATPSAGDDSVQSAFGGRHLPPELTTLWSWRTIPRTAPEMGTDVRPLSPAASAALSRTIAGLYEQQVRDYGPGGWSKDYVIWSQVDRKWLMVDCAALDPTSPVYESADANLTEPPGRVADSLGELFKHWTGLIETGLDFYDGGWTSYAGPPYKPEYPIHGSPR